MNLLTFSRGPVYLLFVAALGLSACSTVPKPADWQLEAKGSLDRSVLAYLEGNSRVEAAELARARTAVSATGRPDLAARLELLHCASHAASLVFEGCAGFERFQPDALPAEQAYARYLSGGALPSDSALLPPQQQAAASGNEAALLAIEEPLSRLVAAAVAFKTGRASPAVVQAAVDTASSQGWRRPLLAWLGVQLSLAEKAGLQDAAAGLRRRIELAQGNLKAVL